MRVLAYSSPARGHLHPMMPALLELRSRGAAVAVRTLSTALGSVRDAGIEAAPIDPAIERIDLDDHAQRSQIKAGARAYEVWGRRAAYEVEDLRRAIADHDPDLLLIDTTTFGARAAAEAGAIPWAESRPFLRDDPAPGLPPYGLGLRPRDDLLGRARDRALGPLVARFDARSRLPTINAGRRVAGLAPLHRSSDAVGRAPLTLYYTAEPFDWPRPANPRIVSVGPCIWDPPGELEIELDERPLVLVSCSSEFQDDGAIAAAALRGLGSSHQVVVTSAGVDPATLPQVPGTIVRRYLPHLPLLERAEVAICHGGMGVTQKALASGVPVVVVPWGRDQLDTAAHVEVAGAGVELSRKRLSPESIAAAAREAGMLAAGARRVAAGYEATGGARRAADELEALLDPGARSGPLARTAADRFAPGDAIRRRTPGPRASDA